MFEKRIKIQDIKVKSFSNILDKQQQILRSGMANNQFRWKPTIIETPAF